MKKKCNFEHSGVRRNTGNTERGGGNNSNYKHLVC